MTTQRELEMEMYTGGIDRAERMMTRAEDKGRAATNPYGSGILSEFVLPIATAIRIELDSKRVGARAMHAKLLATLDEEAVAFLAVRCVVNACMQWPTMNVRMLGGMIGKAVHGELVLSQIADHNPDLYHVLDTDLRRRQSKDERHRLTVFRMQAEKTGTPFIEWPLGARSQVGLYLLGLLEGAGLVEIEPLHMERGKTAPQGVALSFGVLERINQIKGFVAVSMPTFGPCIELPRDWTNAYDGGFHTQELKRAWPCLVRHELSRSSVYREASMPVVYSAVNALQRTEWAVNGRVLDIMTELARTMNVGEITSLADIPQPERPLDLPDVDVPKEQWTEAQAEAFKTWKRKMADWHTERKLAGIRFSRFLLATKMARRYREFDKLYFVYFADSRGRLYPATLGINPQGSDMQKALLHFAEGKAIDSPEAIRWFHVQGANKWGFDKATLEERHAWVVERQDLICSFAQDPLNNRGWTEADSPLQFLAWCLEYRDWVMDTTGEFVSRLPISMDGSCNGLQNLSALLRDEVGGHATNLTPNLVMQDIYKMVAEAALARMQATPLADPERERIRREWLKVGIGRSIVKRSVMTTPYGVTKRTAIDYVIEDHFKKGSTFGFEKKDWMIAASVLMEFAWPAIGDIVVKGVACMDWLQKAARTALKSLPPEAEPYLRWTSPSGFPAAQAYFEQKEHRINTHIAGGMKIRLKTETDKPDLTKHAAGFAPNFVHSLDASHLHLTATAAAEAGIKGLAMIHDDYGTHAADSQKLFEVIRAQFVKMYEDHDPLADLIAKYPNLPPPPDKGTLSIRGVLDSQFFFS